MSQTVFARCLSLTVGYVSQLERVAKRLTGPALVFVLSRALDQGWQAAVVSVFGRAR